MSEQIIKRSSATDISFNPEIIYMLEQELYVKESV